MKKNIFRCALLLMGAFAFASCSDEGDDVTTPELFNATDGVYILCEGSYFSNVAGSLSYLDYATDDVTNGVFASVNGKVLGGTPNDLIIYGSKMYIATTDDNRIWVADANTIQSLGFIEMPQPRKLTSFDGDVYVTSYEGVVSRIDTTSLTVTAQSDRIVGNLEGIAALDGFLYVCTAWNSDYTYNNSVVKLRASDLSKVADIKVRTNPTRILSDGASIYVQSNGNYSDIPSALQRIDADDKVTTLTDGATYMALYNNKIYYIDSAYDANWNVTYSYSAYDLLTGEVSALPVGEEVFSPCGIAIDPCSGIIYISSNSEGEYGMASYTEPGYVVAYSTDGSFKTYRTGVAPSSFAFKTSAHVSE